VRGLKYLPRQEQSNGRIKEYDIFLATNTNAWGARSVSTWWKDTADLQTVIFPQAVSARYLRLVVRSEVNGNPFASIAELDIVADEK